MQARIFFVTGVVGAGKSTMMGPLQALLGTRLDLHDFDERGVPDDVDMEWAAREKRHWISVGVANAEKGLATVICGFAVPGHDDDRELVQFVLLDLDEEALRQRLLRRYSNPANVEELRRMTGKTVEESMRENVGSIPWLRELCSACGAMIIDTSALTPEQTAERVARFIDGGSPKNRWHR
jgi:broad-specificity NMP kinase